MKASGIRISGGKYIGRATLSTVATPLFWYDYRFNETPMLMGGDLRMFQWNPLAGTSNTLTQTADQRRFYRYLTYPSGYGYKNASTGSNFQALGNRFPALDMLHKGINPWMVSFVVYWRKVDAGTSGQTQLFNTGSSAGCTLRINHNQPRVNLQMRGNTTTLFTISTAVDTMPNDQVSVITCLFYGDAAAGNYRILINDVSTAFTQNPTYATSLPCEFLRFGLPVIQTNDIVFKMMIGYDLSGKSRPEVDSILSNYYTVLKTDSEYSGLITI